ncbi:MAG TPA: class I SAM-dependent methyltransferase [Acidimicrobiia bacterium]|nr:class I SAM-dependent methyltransferase [Acidimicrobiia bacterium]
MVHEVAAEGFGAEAATYARSRPSYPPDAIAWFVEHLRLGPGVRVLDLAAGTGIFTRLLAPLGADLVAAEPVGGMRDELRRTTPGVPVIAATAERLPFRDGSLDAVTVAQAFHWFDAPAALTSLRRALRVGGRLGLVWNSRDRSVDWVDRIWSVMDHVEKRAPWREHDGNVAGVDSHAWREEHVDHAPGFTPLVTATFRHEQPMTPELVVERIRGVSHVAVLPPDEQAHVLAHVREIVATHPDTRGRTDLAIPYRVDAYWTERID